MTERSGTAGWTGRVALVLASSTGGIGQHVASLTRGLIAAGTDVTVCGPAATDQRFDFTAAGARFVPVEIPANPQPADALAVRHLRRALADEPGVQVVHAHGLRAGLVAALAHGSRPLVVTWHNVVLAGGLKGRALAVLERVVARAADVTLGASADLVARARELGAAEARLGMVAAPVLPAPKRRRAAVRAELGVPAGAPLVLSVGRLHPQKGYDVLVQAAARWRHLEPAPRVVIAGTGPSYLDLAARISAAHAPITLLGHRSDVADLLGAADLALVTSVWEARQLFAQEAMRAGTPLVATAVGGLPELVGDGAVLVPPRDVDAVDTAVRGLLADPAAAAALAARGRRVAAGWPTERDTVEQVRAVYAELTAVTAGRAAAPAPGRD